MENMLQKLLDFLFSAGIKLVVAVIIVVAGFYLTKWLIRAIKKGRLLHRADPSVQSFLISFTGIALKAIVLITAAAYLGVPMTSMIALLSSAGLALGLALQGGLSNLAGGLMILIFKPFSVGDYITFDDVTGTVVSIGMFYSAIRTDSNVRVVYPNSTLTGKQVVNYSAEPMRRAEFLFSVAYDSDLDTVNRTLLEAAAANEFALADPAPRVYMYSQADSALVYRVLVWTQTENYWPLMFSLNEEVKRALDAAGITIPFPQMDVHLPETAQKETEKHG